ncbi:MAG: 50S ribosomal protein L4 [Cytophagales bacterium]|nr:MAG: 50S ribosomal protein L4 [Cytophagales bacterium]
MQVEVINKEGKATGRTIELSENIYQITPNDHAIYLDVKQYLANQRQGTHKAKERAEVVGSTKKIKKQKGTGTARAGSLKSPVFVGGGTIFGPRPRDYSFKLNKKIKKLARKSALSHKANSQAITVIEDFNIEAKTKQYLEFLNNLNLNNTKTLLLIPEQHKNIYLASRNLPKARVVTYSDINTYEILHADRILLFESTIKKIEELL